MKDDTISRQDAIDAVKKLVEWYKEKWHESRPSSESVIDVLNDLPSAEPEIKPIEYRDCTNAMLRMWMDNVVTDGEYNRIMDKLNAYWIGEE